MIVPHYDAVLHALGTSRKVISGKTTVEVPVSLLNYLLLQVAKHGAFNEAGYLAANPDVATAVKARKVSSGKEHYFAIGFVEGRRGGLPTVDEMWYRKTYPDVAQAIRTGKLATAQQHYDMIGAEEFRAPAREHLQSSFEWKVALGKATRAKG